MLVANWKMNGSSALVNKWIEGVNSSIPEHIQSRCVFCPPACFLYQASNLIKERDLKISLGAQDIDPISKTGLTGGISGFVLKELGCKYVIIGHSENRVNGDDNALINKKIKVSLNNKLKILFCIGENFNEKKHKKTKIVIKSQINNGLKNIKNIKNIIFAYEPVWSIGTGIIPKEHELKNNILFIKQLLKKKFKLKNPKVLYGGSVNPKNIKELRTINQIDGFLIGGASQNSNKFIDIIKKTFN